MNLRAIRYSAIILLVVVAACSPKSITTEPGKRAYTANEVVLRLGEFQDVVIDSQKAGRISTETSREIVTWLSGDISTTPPRIGVFETLKQAPNGWPTTLFAGYQIIRPKIFDIEFLRPWVPVIDSLVAGATP